MSDPRENEGSANEVPPIDLEFERQALEALERREISGAQKALHSVCCAALARVAEATDDIHALAAALVRLRFTFEDYRCAQFLAAPIRDGVLRPPARRILTLLIDGAGVSEVRRELERLAIDPRDRRLLSEDLNERLRDYLSAFTHPMSFRPQIADAPVAAENEFRQSGHFWELRFNGTTRQLKQTRGMTYLHRILQAAPKAIASEMLEDPGRIPTADQPQKIADRKAVEEVKAKLAELHDDLAPAKTDADEAEQERLFVELEATKARAKELKSGKRSRAFRTDRDRSRERVSKAIRHALDEIGKVHPSASLHLKGSVIGGMDWRYEPSQPTEWAM